MENSKLNGVEQTEGYELSDDQLIQEFFFVLCTAHECLLDKEADKSFRVYQGLSPDEITLVDAACRLGYVYLGKYPKFLINF